MALSAVRHVRTPEGAKFYGAPVGSPIVKDRAGKLKAVAGAVFKSQSSKGYGGERTVSPSFLSKIVEAGKAGGFTVDVKDESFKKDGFAVAKPGMGTHFSVKAPDFKQRFREYIHQHYETLYNDPEAYLGGWVDEDTSELWLDVPEVVSSQQEAYRRAKERGEIAIADLAKYAAGEDGDIRIDYRDQTPPKGSPAYDEWIKGNG
jgi:hypothetical protein